MNSNCRCTILVETWICYASVVQYSGKRMHLFHIRGRPKSCYRSIETGLNTLTPTPALSQNQHHILCTSVKIILTDGIDMLVNTKFLIVHLELNEPTVSSWAVSAMQMISRQWAIKTNYTFQGFSPVTQLRDCKKLNITEWAENLPAPLAAAPWINVNSTMRGSPKVE